LRKNIGKFETDKKGRKKNGDLKEKKTRLRVSLDCFTWICFKSVLKL